MPNTTPDAAPYAERADFILELAQQLHAYGTTSQRLEGGLLAVARRLQVECEPWVNPTGMIITLRDGHDPEHRELTRVIRVPPGETDLARLSRADHIAEQVIAGKLGVAEGHAELQALAGWQRSRNWRMLHALAFGLVAGAVAALLRLPWLDIATATIAGLGIGGMDWWASRHPLFRDAFEALAAFFAAALTVLVAAYVGALNMNTVIIASVIVLLPGLALTNALNELAGQHLTAGTARFAGAIGTVLKLTIGTMFALEGLGLLGVEPQIRAARPQPWMVEAVGLIVAGWAFAVLFRASRRDYPLVMTAAMTGYLVSRVGGLYWGNVTGVFISALLITMAGNLYGRLKNRPGALVRVPGIIMMVPGSISLRSLMTSMQEQNFSAGQASLILLLNILMALIAGLLLGNLFMPARRNL